MNRLLQKIVSTPTLQLTIFLILLFISTEFLGQSAQFAFSLDDPSVSSAILSVYTHNSLGHLFSNVIVLLIVGSIFEYVTTRLQYHLFFYITGFFSILMESIVHLITSNPTPILGSSGAIFAIFGYLAVSNTFTKIIFHLTGFKKRNQLIVLLGFSVLLTLIFSSPKSAYFAHATGFILGGVCGLTGMLRKS